MKERKTYYIQVIYDDKGDIDSIDIAGNNTLKEIMELNAALFSQIKFQILAEADFYETKDLVKAKKLLDKTSESCNNIILRKHLIKMFLDYYNEYTDEELDKMNFKITIFEKDDDIIDIYSNKLTNAENVDDLFTIFKDILSQPSLRYEPNVENKCTEYSTSLNHFQKMNIMLYEWGSFLKQVTLEDKELASHLAIEFSKHFKDIIYEVLGITPKED